jgi:hypothetical protein
MRYAPLVGPTIEVTREVVEVAAAAVEVADIAVREGDTLLTSGLDLSFTDGRVDLEPILAARELVEQLPLERLATARTELQRPTVGWLPEEVVDGRADTLELANETVDLLERADALTQALPGFLGADGPKRYFVGVQTSAELRGTGGMVGYWALLSVDDGRFVFGSGEEFDPLGGDEPAEGESRTERIGSIRLAYEDPPGTDPEFRARYGTLSGPRSFTNVNLDPDLPTSATAMLNLYELLVGERLDGVLLLDAPGLQRLLEPTGDRLPLPDDLATLFGYDEGLPTDEFSRFITEEIYDTLGVDRTDERNDALRRIGDLAFTEVASGGWDAAAMVGAIASATRERHLQVFIEDDEVQDAFTAVNATGSLEPRPDTDLFAITANNLVGGKQDVHLGYRFTYDLEIERIWTEGDGSVFGLRQGNVDVTVDNPLPSSGVDLYVIGSCYLPDARNRCFEGQPGQNRTWFSLWMDGLSRATSFESDTDGPLPGAGATFRDLRVVDHVLTTPSQGEAGFEVGVAGPVPLRIEPGAAIYELDLWRQAKAVPDLVEVRVAAPEGWAIGGVEVAGGGSGTGQGVYGEGVPLTAEVVDGVAVVRGTVTADTRIEVALVDPASVVP